MMRIWGFILLLKIVKWKERTCWFGRERKRILPFIIGLMALTACTPIQIQATPDPAAPDMSQAALPNPASAYCNEKGNKLEIHTAADGSQNGICIFPDGSTCDEWPISG
jgi:hypothetical protein